MKSIEQLCAVVQVTRGNQLAEQHWHRLSDNILEVVVKICNAKASLCEQRPMRTVSCEFVDGGALDDLPGARQQATLHARKCSAMSAVLKGFDEVSGRVSSYAVRTL